MSMISDYKTSREMRAEHDALMIHRAISDRESALTRQAAAMQSQIGAMGSLGSIPGLANQLGQAGAHQQDIIQGRARGVIAGQNFDTVAFDRPNAYKINRTLREELQAETNEWLKDI